MAYILIIILAIWNLILTKLITRTRRQIDSLELRQNNIVQQLEQLLDRL